MSEPMYGSDGAPMFETLMESLHREAMRMNLAEDESRSAMDYVHGLAISEDESRSLTATNTTPEGALEAERLIMDSVEALDAQLTECMGPGCAFTVETDNEGQLVIYTGLYLPADADPLALTDLPLEVA